MDTDTIREKHIRSQEALNRLKEDISQLIFTRVQDLKTTQEYLEALIKEKEAVDTDITEQEAKIASLRDDISSNKGLIQNLQQKQTQIIDDEQNTEARIREIDRELKAIEMSTETVKKEIEKIKLDVDNTKIAISDYGMKIQNIESKLTQEVEQKEDEWSQLTQEIKKIQTENGVLSFLLEESAEDIPEVDILAELMKTGRSTMDQLKKSLEGITSPVIITRTVGRMMEKRLITFHQTNETYSANQ
jgi:chromosome segregation ATPase